ELGQTRAALFQRNLELAHMTGIGVVEIQHLGDVGEAEAQPSPAQNEAESRPVAMREDPRLPLSQRLEQALVLVKADGPVRAAEFVGEVANRKPSLVSFCGNAPWYGSLFGQHGGDNS